MPPIKLTNLFPDSKMKNQDDVTPILKKDKKLSVLPKQIVDKLSEIQKLSDVLSKELKNRNASQMSSVVDMVIRDISKAITRLQSLGF